MDVDLKKDVGDLFLDEFASKYLKNSLYNLVYTKDLKNTGEFEVIGNCSYEDSIMNLSNALYCLITEYFMVNNKTDSGLIKDINNLKNILDRLNYL
jgi:hypothetical protein